MKVHNRNKWRRGWTGIIRALGLCALALIYVWGCSPSNRPAIQKPAPQQAAEYGKFVVYRVGDAKVYTVDGTYGAHQIPYLVGETFLPSAYPYAQEDYNYLRLGDGSENPPTYFQDFYYRDFNLNPGQPSRYQRGASDNPDGVVVNDQLKLYFTNQPFQIVSGAFSGEYTYNLDEIPDTPLPPTDPNIKYMALNSYMIPGFQHDYPTMDGNTVDVDVMAIQVPRDHTIVRFRIIAHQIQLATWVSFFLSIIDSDMSTVLAESYTGFDSFYFNDPEIGYNFPRAGTYYLKLEDRNHNRFPPNADNNDYTKHSWYALICEADTAPAPNGTALGEAFIRRGDLQPARNGNPKLDGGKTFEPDDVRTLTEDFFPDCDGIPNTGDEGDWGVDERCGSPPGKNGVQDGHLNWWEIDVRSNLDDGEYLTAKNTNIRSSGFEAPSVMVAPGEDKLWMWINAGDGIYQLDSLDGLEGLNWDLSNFFNDRPALRPGQGGDPDAPVVSSGVYGYCETPASNSDVQVVDVCSVQGQPVGCKGYPNTIGITYGQDNVLETPPQEDDLDPAQNVITSGPDGIINTFFVPTHLHYGAPHHIVEVTVPAGGPANPDVLCADSVPTANDSNAYLLGDDVWAPALTITPAEYWRQHGCVFFSLADNFNQCAMGIPETLAIRPGADGLLHTVEDLLFGDDQLCHQVSEVGICQGPSGRFDWETIYLPLQGDDQLCIQQDPVLGTNEVGICGGFDGVLETPIIDQFIPVTDAGTGLLTPGDVCCDATEVVPACTTPGGIATCCSAICPGNDHRLQSLWVLYFADLSIYKLPITGFTPYVFGKGDFFTDFDDEMCVIDGQIGLCQGDNGYFQSYPLAQHHVVKQYEDYEDLLLHFKGLANDCYSLEVKTNQGSFAEVPEKVFTLYRNEGVMFDDAIRWDQAQQEFFISTGTNGLNQTCKRPGDEQLIEHLRGLPNQPIILPGNNRVLDTPALKDELVRVSLLGRDMLKIGTGADGIANSFALGDDRSEIFMGTGQADYPCVLAGADGKADTAAQGNDPQLFRPGDVAGFDSYQVGYPDVVREGEKLYLFYTGLGWGQVPPNSHRADAASVGLIGECSRAGLDHVWGSREVSSKLDWTSVPPFIMATYLERSLVDKNGSPRYGFIHALDNNQGVALAPRIGVATSTVKRIEADPGDWDRRVKPVIDLGEVCNKALDLPISVPGLTLPGSENSVNYNGAYSSDTFIYHEKSSSQPIFVMAFSGLFTTTQQEPGDDAVGIIETFTYQVGLARSLNGLKWDVAYDLGNLMVAGSVLDSLFSSRPAPQYRNPTLVRGKGGSFNMFFDEFTTLLGSNPGMNGVQFGADDTAWIGFAVRAGDQNPSTCLDLAGSPSSEEQGARPIVLSLIVIAVPLLIGLGWRLSRRKSLSP